jgi:hypothetical protein
MNKNIVVKKGKPIAYHTFYGVNIPIALRVEDYGYPISTKDDTVTVALGDSTLAITKDWMGSNHIQFYKDRKLLFQFKDLINGNTLIRVIGGVTVIMKDNKVTCNKVYPKR